MTECPECGAEVKGSRCACGWRSPQQAPALTAEQVVRIELGRVKTIPKELPPSKDDAVKYLLGLFEPADEHWERPVTEVGRYSGEPHTQYPYVDRVRYLTRKYIGATKDTRKLIAAAREDGVFWRGEDERTFAAVIHETMSYRQVSDDPEERRGAAVKKARILSRKVFRRMEAA